MLPQGKTGRIHVAAFYLEQQYVELPHALLHAEHDDEHDALQPDLSRRRIFPVSGELRRLHRQMSLCDRIALCSLPGGQPRHDHHEICE